jgi:hypothetical protein
MSLERGGAVYLTACPSIIKGVLCQLADRKVQLAWMTFQPGVDDAEKLDWGY